MTTILDEAQRITKEFVALSNIYRVLIIIYLYKRDNAKWSEIKEFIERYTGNVNPNTLQFHLKALIHIGYVKRSGSNDSSIYSLDIDNIPKVVREKINLKIENNGGE